MTSAFHPLYFKVFPQAATVTPRAHGLDLSKYDLYFKPEEATGQLDFVVQRVSYGITRDEAFMNLVGGVMDVPIRGGYHYLSSWQSWRLQADKYLEYVAPYEYHFHNCDFESAFNTMSFAYARMAWDWIHYVEDKTGKPTLLYTSPSLYNQWIRPTQRIVDWNTVDLWTAQWFNAPNPNGTPTMPIGRTAGWKLWQYTDRADGRLYGVARPAACDLDVFNGTVEQMKGWLNVNSEPIPQPGGSMFFKVVSTSSNIRSSAGVVTSPSNDLGDDNLETNDIVETDDIPTVVAGVTWRKLSRWWRGNVERPLPASPTGERWAAEKGGTVFYMISTIFTPPPSPSGDYLLHFKSDGTVKKYVPE